MIRPTLLVAYVTIRELLYEKVFYLLLAAALAALGVSMLLSQLTYAEQAKLLTDFMLGGIQISMILFSVFMAISLFHREMTVGSIYMILSKPVSRWVFLFGKFLGQFAVQSGVILVMAVITLAVCARFPEFAPKAILQACFLISLECAALTAMTYLFVVNAGAITAAAATLSLFALGHLGDRIDDNIGKSIAATVWVGVKSLIPNLELFNMKAMASYGLSISYTELALAAAYGVVCVAVFLLAAAVCFNHKDIST